MATRNRIGTLSHTGTYQQTTVWTAYDSYLCEFVYLLSIKIFGCRYEIVKYILFLHFGSGNMPVFPYSLPPRRLTCTYMPPFSRKGMRLMLNEDTDWCWNLRNRIGIPDSFHSSWALFGKVRNMGILAPSLLGKKTCSVTKSSEWNFTFEHGTIHNCFLYVIFIGSSRNSKRSKAEETFFIVFITVELTDPKDGSSISVTFPCKSYT